MSQIKNRRACASAVLFCFALRSVGGATWPEALELHLEEPLEALSAEE